MAGLIKTFYPSLKMVINGGIVTNIKDASIEHNPALNPVTTQAGRGHTKGAQFVTISGTMAIPAEGPDFNPSTAMKNSERVDVAVFNGPLQMQTQGVFTQASVAYSVEAETTWSFTLEADFADFA